MGDISLSRSKVHRETRGFEPQGVAPVLGSVLVRVARGIYFSREEERKLWLELAGVNLSVRKTRANAEKDRRIEPPLVG